MAKKLFISAELLLLVFILGCDEPAVKDDPRFRADPTQATFVTTQGFGVPDAAEADKVEHLAQKRNEYRQSLVELLRHYQMSADITKRQWAQHELEALDRVPHYRYLMTAEVLPPDLIASSDIEDANILFNEAMELYKQAGGLLIITDEDKLRGALNKFNQVIARFPSSNKIDDSAYRAGRIYEHFKDWEIAMVYYQRCFQWNDVTAYPARFRAGYILDQRLLRRTEALTLYQLSVEREARYTKNTEFAQKRILELTKPGSQPGAPAPLPGSTMSNTSVDAFSETLDTMP
ncbi:MAG: hypothetical protein IH624_02250 [Phycisphaerae bacterium]|nr:hypothetical protein [Phycisphaerae bacterium]